MATIGTVSNEEHKNIVIGKAWRYRRMWFKPKNRGKSMNPVDHPHGWWEGRTSIGLRYPKAFNGKQERKRNGQILWLLVEELRINNTYSIIILKSIHHNSWQDPWKNDFIYHLGF